MDVQTIGGSRKSDGENQRSGIATQRLIQKRHVARTDVGSVDLTVEMQRTRLQLLIPHTIVGCNAVGQQLGLGHEQLEIFQMSMTGVGHNLERKTLQTEA